MGTTPGMDCCKLMAGWMIENGWPDPVVEYRAIYQGPAIARRLILRAGGLLALVGQRMAELGIAPVRRARCAWASGGDR